MIPIKFKLSVHDQTEMPIRLVLILGATSDDVSVVIECLDAMINRRHKQVSIQRVLAYIKRLCTLSLQTLPSGSLSYLCTIRNVMKVSSVLVAEIDGV